MKKNRHIPKKSIIATAGLGLAGLVLAYAPGCIVHQYDVTVEKPPIETIKSYDNHSYYLRDDTLDRMEDIVYKIVVQRTYQNDKTKEENSGQGIGTGFVVREKNDLQYLITANHVTDAQKKITNTWSGDTYSLVKNEAFVEINGKHYPLDILVNNAEADVSVVRTRRDLDLNLDEKIDFAQLPLEAGDVVYAVGFPLNRGKFLSKGIITMDERETYFFYTSSALNPGNSGGPLYVLLNGKPRIAGLASFLIRGAQGMFGAIHYRHLTDALGRALEVPEKEEPKKEPEKPKIPEDIKGAENK